MRSLPAVFLVTLLAGRVAAQDSLALVFRQDNLTTVNNVQIQWSRPLARGVLTWENMLRTNWYQSASVLEEDYSLEDRTQLRWLIPLRGNWETGVLTETNWYRDRRRGQRSDLLNRSVQFPLKWQKGTFSQVLAGVGLRSIQRFGFLDRGPTATLDLQRNWQTGAQQFTSTLEGARDWLEQTENQRLRLRLGYDARFSSQAYLRSTLMSNTHSQEFYTDSLGSLQKRRIRDSQWRNRLGYRINRHVELFHQLEYVDQGTRIDRRHGDGEDLVVRPGENRTHVGLNNESGLEYAGRELEGRLALRIENSQNRYYVDYNEHAYQLRLEMLLPGLPGLDTLGWQTAYTRQAYDTPDTTNDDDRDEIRLTSTVWFSWSPAPTMRMELGSKVNLFHLVYLFASRSSENHWNRSLIFWTRSDWWSGAWHLHSFGRVHANYFAYDYDDLLESLGEARRSFVHRSLNLDTQLSRRLGPRWQIQGQTRILQEDDGRLDWGRFLQEVQSDLHQEEWTFRLQVRLRGWQLWAGGLHHIRLKTYVDPNRAAERWEGAGPILGWQTLWSMHWKISADLRYLQVRDGDREYDLPKFELQVSWQP